MEKGWGSKHTRSTFKHRVRKARESHEEGEARFTPESKVSSLKSLAGSRDNEGVVLKKMDPGWPTLPGET